MHPLKTDKEMDIGREKEQGMHIFSEYVYTVEEAGTSGTVTPWCVGGGAYFIS